MRKPVYERKNPLDLNDVADDPMNVSPRVRMFGFPAGVEFDTKYRDGTEMQQTWTQAVLLRDAAAIREVRDQLTAWLEEFEVSE